jgi:hypothetical protein
MECETVLGPFTDFAEIGRRDRDGSAAAPFDLPLAISTKVVTRTSA